MTFRFDIGFLRAFSVIAVVLYHFKIPFFEGGFVGVDIFFVISGFLMTKIILSGFEKNNFSLREFYMKRVKRILPALLFMSLSVLLLCNVFFTGNDLKLTAKFAFLSNVFLSNIYYCLHNGYFDAASQNNIFLHTWSLAVEWQFYMIYPVFLLFIRKLYFNKKRLFNLVFFLLVLLSFIMTVLLVNDYADFTFYMFPTRAWEMMFGGAAFLLSATFGVSNLARRPIVIIGYILIIFSVFYFKEGIQWPSFYSLLPVVSTSVILMLNADFFVLKDKKIQFFGDISYSLYLWHWPIYVLFNYFGYINTTGLILMILISVLMAYLSYSLVENSKSILIPSYIRNSLVFALVISSLLFLYPTNGFSKMISMYSSKSFEMMKYVQKQREERSRQFNPCGCFITSDGNYQKYNFSECLKINKNKKNILLLGDSHAAQFSKSLREQLDLKKNNLLELSAGYSFPFLNTRGMKLSRKLMQYLFNDFIPKNAENIDLVIISNHWLMNKSPELLYSNEEIKNNLLITLNYFSKKGIRVVVLGQTEAYRIPFPKMIAVNDGYNSDLETKYLNEESSDMNEYLKSVLPKGSYIDLYNIKGLEKVDKTMTLPYMVDSNHYTKYGADKIVKYLMDNNLLKL